MIDEPMKVSPTDIAFDIDGVFANTFCVFADWARRKYGYRFQYQDITEYEFMKVVQMDQQISEKILRALLDFPLESGIKPMDGAVRVLTRLSGSGPILFVTARSGRAPILKWIRHYLPEVDTDYILVEATNTHEGKLPVLLKNRVRYFVEDRLDTCYLLRQASITPVVYDQPWNRKAHPFAVVRTWREISDLIEWP
jgi:uncharacterized HAD superfamily protein